MDFQSMSLAALFAIGVVNVILMVKPNIDSRVKFIIAFVAGFAVLFVPQELSNMLLDKVRQAIEIAFIGSGIYKVAQKVGGN